MDYQITNMAPDSDQVIIDVFNLNEGEGDRIQIHVERDMNGQVHIRLVDHFERVKDQL
jgi:hypothetical protein